MSKEWICADCVCFDTDACYYGVKDGKYPACNKIVVDHDKAYQQGRADEHEKVVQRITEILSLEIANCKNCPIDCEVATYGSCQEELKKYLLEQLGADE